MVESRRTSRGLTEADNNNFSMERFLVSAEDQIQITEAESDVSWRVHVMRCVPLTVGVNKYEGDQIRVFGRPKDLVPNAKYKVGGQSIFIMTTAEIGVGYRVLRMIGPEGTQFEKVSSDQQGN